MKLWATLAFGAVCALGACTQTAEPRALGDGRYLLGIHARGGMQSNAALLAASVDQAHGFCARENKRAVIETTGASGAQGWTPQNTQVVFKCVER